MRKYYIIILLVLISVIGLSSCRDDQEVVNETVVQVQQRLPENEVPPGRIYGFYLLNEGNMGMNKASLDYMNFETGNYHINMYPTRNPNIVKELGDVGNDIKKYGNKVYAVINCSNYIEIFDAKTGIHEGSITVPNCRYLAFHDGKGYISSYAGAVAIDPNAQKGFVAEFDTINFNISRTVDVGYQPDEVLVHNNKLYVANSGGYRVPNYDHTVSVIDLNTFQIIKTIDVAINLHRLQKDKRGDIYVSSRGDYDKTPPNLYVIDSQSDEVKQKLDVPVGNMTMHGDSLYYYSVAFNNNTGSNTITYGILDTRTKTVISDKIITDGTDKQIRIPYGLAVHPATNDIYITDAQNYVVSGYVYCFNSEGKLRWRVLKGNIPSHIAFVNL